MSTPSVGEGVQDRTRYRCGLTVRERWQFACKLRHMAAVLRVPTIGEPWPDWMTPERCAEMANKADEGARLVEPLRDPRNG